MNLANQTEKATAFRKLHDRSRILVLPNAWDAVSARVLEAAGFPAVATTSAGVAWALGYPDGERVPRDQMIAAIGRIARRVVVPATADIEAGFGSHPFHGTNGALRGMEPADGRAAGVAGSKLVPGNSVRPGSIT